MSESAPGGNQNEVRVALVMDDQASATLNKVAEALAHVNVANQRANTEAKKQGGIWESIKGNAIGGAIAGAAGFGFHAATEAVHKGWEMVSEAWHEGLSDIESGRGIANTLMMVDSSGASFDMLHDKARLFKDDLEEMGIAAGTSADEIAAVFEGIAARSNKTAGEVADLTDAISQAGRAVKGGPGSLGQGFAMMEMGMVRAKNPVVQLIAATQTLHGNAKSVASQLQKMTPEQQMKLGEKAIEKMAEKMRNVPLTWEQTVQSMKGIKEQMLESLGVPLVKELTPYLISLRDMLNANKEEVFHYGEALAKRALKIGKETFDWGKTIWDQINTASVREMLTDGAHAVETAFGMAREVTKFSWTALSGLVGKLGESYQGWKTMIAEAREYGMFGDWGKRGLHEGKRDQHQADAKEQASYAANPVYRKAAQEQLDAMATENRRIEALGGTITHDMENAYIGLKDQIERAQYQGEEAERIVAQNDETKFAQLYKNAATKHDEGLQFYMTKLLSGNEKLQDALIKGGFGLEGSFAEIAARMANAQGVDSEAAKKFAMKIKTAGDKSSPTVNFNGGQTFNIKQDFRDQDPDRVAVIFRQDITRAATSRVTSRNSMAFGF